MKIPATISPEVLTAVVDTREQNPLDLAPLRTVTGTLDTGDYGIQGLEHHIRIERKSLADLLTCCGKDRDRFEKQLQRLRSFPVGVLAVETSWNALEMGEWQSGMKPTAVVGTMLGVIADGTTVLFGDSHERLGRLVSRLLYVTARRHYRATREMLKAADMEARATA